jgi:SAM-dependent methyltransferase
VVDVACGIGTHLRELARRGCTDLVGVDVVWAKLWLARRFVCPTARYVCADVPATPDLGVPTPAYVLCHDAFYFLRDKPAAAAAMRALAGDGGTVVVGHAHVADPHGEPLTPEGYAAVLGTDLLYDDAELTTALLGGRPPRPAPAADLHDSEAVALVAGDPCSPAPVDLGEPLPPLRPNPLYADGELRWPSERYAGEYGPRSGYLPARSPDPLPADAARRRLLVDLPEAW